MVFTIRIDGLEKVRRDFDGFSRNLPKAGIKAIDKFANKLAEQLREEARAKGHISSGWLTNEKGTYAQRVGEDHWIIKMPFYTRHLEKGTQPGYWIPRRKMWRWAKRRGINFYALKHHIYKHGTKAHPFTARVINREVKRLKKQVERRMNNAMKRTAR